jgi:hypothetical protein
LLLNIQLLLTQEAIHYQQQKQLPVIGSSTALATSKELLVVAQFLIALPQRKLGWLLLTEGL